MSLYNWVYGGVFPFSSFMVGTMSERHGVSIALLLNGTLGLGLLTLLAAARPWRAESPRRARDLGAGSRRSSRGPYP